MMTLVQVTRSRRSSSFLSSCLYGLFQIFWDVLIVHNAFNHSKIYHIINSRIMLITPRHNPPPRLLLTCLLFLAHFLKSQMIHHKGCSLTSEDIREETENHKFDRNHIQGTWPPCLCGDSFQVTPENSYNSEAIRFFAPALQMSCFQNLQIFSFCSKRIDICIFIFSI